MVIHRIVSGEEPTVGMRVFTNDWAWGTIVKVADPIRFDGMDIVCGTYCDCWHTVENDNGSTKIYNCDRLTTRKPV